MDSVEVQIREVTVRMKVVARVIPEPIHQKDVIQLIVGSASHRITHVRLLGAYLQAVYQDVKIQTVLIEQIIMLVAIVVRMVLAAVMVDIPDAIAVSVHVRAATVVDLIPVRVAEVEIPEIPEMADSQEIQTE